jgi:outer membrane protein OmpA-like peptidoglycan-associated protein/ribosomal protein L31E
MNRYILTGIIFVLANIAFAQEQAKPKEYKFGLYGGMNYNRHTGDFSQLKDIPNCCPVFTSGSGVGFSFGGVFEYRLNKSFFLGTRVNLMSLNGEMSSLESEYLMSADGVIQGEFEHTMNGNFTVLGIEPQITFVPIKKMQLSMGVVPMIAFSSTYEQKETIVDDSGNGYFVDAEGNSTHERVRNEFSGDIPDAKSLLFALSGAIEYEVPINADTTLLLAPRLAYYLPMTEAVTDTDWKIASISAGISLKYSYRPKPPIIKEEIKRQKYEFDTVRVESDIFAERKVIEGELYLIDSQLNETDTTIVISELYGRTDTLQIPITYRLEGSVIAKGVDIFGKEGVKKDFKVEEFVSNRLDPMLNYVFFEEGESKLPERYRLLSKNQADDFKPEDLIHAKTLDIYYNALNLIGLRLKETSGTIRLTGCNSGTGPEENNIDLARNRTEFVKQYLVQTWGIDESRITTEARNLPAKPSTPIEEAEKMQENRRVEIYTDNNEILKPVFIEKVDKTASPETVRFTLDYFAEAGMKEATLTAYHKDNPQRKFIRKFEGEIPKTIDWKITEDLTTTPETSGDIVYALEITDEKGNEFKTKEQTLVFDVVTVEKKRQAKAGDFETERYSLILFDFAKSSISKDNQEIIDFISGRIKPGAKITIKGFTDNTGDPDYNMKLATRRAKAARKALGKPATIDASINGNELFNTSLPEGRFYCRTVIITVETEI